jgi:hypothetical protein
VERLIGGWQSFVDVCSGWPLAVIYIKVKEYIDQLIWDD